VYRTGASSSEETGTLWQAFCLEKLEKYLFPFSRQQARRFLKRKTDGARSCFLICHVGLRAILLADVIPFGKTEKGGSREEAHYSGSRLFDSCLGFARGGKADVTLVPVVFYTGESIT
jgi:hypothetical protein